MSPDPSIDQKQTHPADVYSAFFARYRPCSTCGCQRKLADLVSENKVLRCRDNFCVNVLVDKEVAKTR